MSFFILLLGFFLLIWGADHFVAGASSLAQRLGVPPLIVGLTVVAFGTSAPELTVSVTAGLSHANEIAISNVLGSNLFNLLVVVGGCAIFTPLVADRALLRRDWPASILANALLLALIAADGLLSTLDGLALLGGLAIVLLLQLRAALADRAALHSQRADTAPLRSPLLIGCSIVVGIAAIVLGGQFAVDGATEIARLLGLSETVIGLTVVAVGTSLPELVTSITATRRGENGIAIGNVIGSNLFNFLLILGVSATLTPIAVTQTAIVDAALLLVLSILVLILARKHWLGRLSGLSMVVVYGCYTAWIVLRELM